MEYFIKLVVLTTGFMAFQAVDNNLNPITEEVLFLYPEGRVTLKSNQLYVVYDGYEENDSWYGDGTYRKSGKKGSVFTINLNDAPLDMTEGLGVVRWQNIFKEGED